MPELPDVELYVEALRRRLVGEKLERARLASPFLLRSVEPPLGAVEGRRVTAVRRLGKRIVYAESECNYCAACQTEGRLPADRALSRLLKKDWPRTLEELGERLHPRAEAAP